MANFQNLERTLVLTAAALVAKVLIAKVLTGKGPARALVKGEHLEDWATSRAGRKRFSMAATVVMRQRDVGGLPRPV